MTLEECQYVHYLYAAGQCGPAVCHTAPVASETRPVCPLSEAPASPSHTAPPGPSMGEEERERESVIVCVC